EPELKILAARQLDVTRNRPVDDGIEAASQIVGARLQPDAVDSRAGERRAVELPVGIAAAARARIADDPDAAAIGRRSGDVLIAVASGAALIAEGHVVRRRARRGPDAGELPVVDDQADHPARGAVAFDVREIPDEIPLERVPVRDEGAEQLILIGLIGADR